MYRIAQHLKYLVYFYAIDNYPSWGMMDEGYSNKGQSKKESESLTLDEAVVRYPERGLQELANVLGIVADDAIKQCLLDARMRRMQPRQALDKWL